MDAQLQNVFSTFNISGSSSSEERLDQLRKVPASTLVQKLFDLDIHTFRGVTDDEMISSNLISNIQSGAFAARFAKHGMRILIGEAETEEVLYALTNPPPSSSESDMLRALSNYYAQPVCIALLSLYTKEGASADSRVQSTLSQQDPEKAKQLFGLITSDVQVRAPIRVLSKALFDGGIPSERVLRYRVAYRPECTDKVYPKSFGVTHGADSLSWWFVERYGFTEEERQRVKEWLGRTLVPLVAGAGQGGEKLGVDEFLYFQGDGKIEVVGDGHWGWMMRVAEKLA